MTLAAVIPLLIVAIVIVIVVVALETILEPTPKVMKLIRLLAGVIFLAAVLRVFGYA